MEILLDTLGWTGGAAFVGAYYLVSAGKLKADGWEYQALNLFGAIAVGVSAFPKRAWPALGLEVVWGAIAVIALVRFFHVQKQNK
jgi:hypothetical protein